MTKEKLIIETVSHFYSPLPNRGKKNEPSFIIFTLKKVAELRKIDQNELAKITTDNFNKLFSK